MATHSPTVLLTGSNTGLGFEIAKALSATGVPFTLLMGGRSESKVVAAIEKLKGLFPKTATTFVPITVDIESDSSIAAAAEWIASHGGKVDVLLNNAGANLDFSLKPGDPKLREVWNKMWDINVTGAHALTLAIAPFLVKSPDGRLVFTTSGTASVAETLDEGIFYNAAATTKGWPKPGIEMGYPGYRSTKTGINLVMRDWHRVLQVDGVKVWSVDPGFLATNFAGIGPEKAAQMGAVPPNVGGEFIRDVVLGKRDKDVGLALRRDGIMPW